MLGLANLATFAKAATCTVGKSACGQPIQFVCCRCISSQATVGSAMCGVSFGEECQRVCVEGRRSTITR